MERRIIAVHVQLEPARRITALGVLVLEIVVVTVIVITIVMTVMIIYMRGS